MGCAACFPAIASSARPSALAFYRNTKGCLSPLLPLFAVVAFAGECTGLAESSAMVPQPARDGRPSHRAGGHALVFGNWWTANLLCVGLAFDDRGVDLIALTGQPPLRTTTQTRLTALAVAETKRNDAMYLNITGMTCDSCATYVKDAPRKCRACCRRSCPTRKAPRNSPPIPAPRQRR